MYELNDSFSALLGKYTSVVKVHSYNLKIMYLIFI